MILQLAGKLEEVCPYCSVVNETEVVSRGKQWWATFLGYFGYKGSKTITIRSLRLNCIFCERSFVLLKFQDQDWIRDSLEWEDSVRNGMIEIFGTNLTRDNILENITGIALRNDDTLDICFKKGRKRAYMSCVKQGKGYKGIYMEEINFG